MPELNTNYLTEPIDAAGQTLKAAQVNNYLLANKTGQVEYENALLEQQQKAEDVELNKKVNKAKQYLAYISAPNKEMAKKVADIYDLDISEDDWQGPDRTFVDNERGIKLGGPQKAMEESYKKILEDPSWLTNEPMGANEQGNPIPGTKQQHFMAWAASRGLNAEKLKPVNSDGTSDIKNYQFKSSITDPIEKEKFERATGMIDSGSTTEDRYVDDKLIAYKESNPNASKSDIATKKAGWRLEHKRAQAPELKAGEIAKGEGEAYTIDDITKAKKEAELNVEKKYAFPKVAAKYKSAKRNFNDVYTYIDRAISRVDDWTTGYGSLIKEWPASTQNQLNEDLKTIKANIFMLKLKELKEFSPSGATGMGNLSDTEGETVKASLGSLEQKQKADILKSNLQTIKNSWKSLEKDTDDMINLEYGDLIKETGFSLENKPGIPDGAQTGSYKGQRAYKLNNKFYDVNTGEEIK